MNQPQLHNTLITDSIYEFATSPSPSVDMPPICFAARMSGLYRSDDGGATWYSIYDTLNLTTPLPTMSVALVPRPNGEPTVIAGLNIGLMLSKDGGKHWEPPFLPSPAIAVTCLTMSPNFVADSLVFAGTMEDGVFCSSNGGQTWTPHNFGLLDYTIYALMCSPNFMQDKTLLAGTHSGVFRSINGGHSWREVEMPIGYDPVLCFAASPNYASDHILFAGTETKGLLRSIDGGRHWECMGATNLTEPINKVILAPNYPDTPDILILLGVILMISHDDGASYHPHQGESLANHSISTVAPISDSRKELHYLIGLHNGDVLLRK